VRVPTTVMVSKGESASVGAFSGVCCPVAVMGNAANTMVPISDGRAGMAVLLPLLNTNENDYHSHITWKGANGKLCAGGMKWGETE
jgi:hypothetical protein